MRGSVALGAAALAWLAACGARTELPAPGQGGGDVSSTGAVSTGAPPCGDVEGCNGRDDDCDGTIDEDCVAIVDVGCADGQREGFLDLEAFLDIAACAGGFDLPGVVQTVASCGRTAGDDGAVPGGAGCSAEDLCAPGWTVCPSEAEVARLAGGCAGADELDGQFFATQQSGPGCGICALGTNDSESDCSCVCTEGCAPRPWTTNDLFGCGSLGQETARCGVLDRFSQNLCGELGPPWECGATSLDGEPASCREATVVRKPGPERGGVLCCRALRSE